jgi:hypothetical protein
MPVPVVPVIRTKLDFQIENRACGQHQAASFKKRLGTSSFSGSSQ